MTKSDNLCQYLCSCFSPPSSSKRRIGNNHNTYTVKKRISTSLRDDIPDDHHHQVKTKNQEDIEEGAEEEESRTSSTDESVNNYRHQVNSSKMNPPRSSKSMVIGTFFGQKRGHVCFCIQYDRLNSKPSLLLQFSLPTYLLIKEMKCGLVRIALESCSNHRNTTDNNNNNNDGDDNNDTPSRRNSTSNVLPLLSIPTWTMCINGRKVGFASRRRTTDKDRLILKTMKSMTVGAGVIPAGSLISSSSTKSDHHQSQEGGGGEDGDVIYMRANYERVIGNIDSESFHLINPDGFSGQELSIFLLRSR